MSIEYQHFEPEHVDRVLDLWSRSEGVDLGSDSPPSLLRFLERNPGLSWVALRDDRVVGAEQIGQLARVTAAPPARYVGCQMVQHQPSDRVVASVGGADPDGERTVHLRSRRLQRQAARPLVMSAARKALSCAGQIEEPVLVQFERSTRLEGCSL